MSDDGFYHAFEAAFRGSREEIRIRLKAYHPYLEPLLSGDTVPHTALDLGCGRGEWLEWLGDLGFAARGVDLDAAMLDDARALGLEVAQTDALEALGACEDGALGLVSAFHLIEHVPFADLQKLVAEARRVLAPGGLLILETPNSENIDVATVTFHNDPTHEAPVPPNVLRFLAEHAGFAQICLRRLNERPLVAGGDISLEDVFTQVSPDYAVIAQKDGPSEVRDPLRELLSREQGLMRGGLADRFEDRLAERADMTDLALTLQSELHHVRHAHATLSDAHHALAARVEALLAEETPPPTLAERGAAWRDRITHQARALLARPAPAVAELPPPAPTPAPAAPPEPEAPAGMARMEPRPAAGPLPDVLSWRMEGPFDSSYSLSIVNRALARALEVEGAEVALVSAEGPGPFAPSPDFLGANPDVQALWQRDGADAAIVSRNMYPPRVSDIGAGFTGLHNYAWEETGLPEAYVEVFNRHLSFLTVPSEHVRKVMIDNGLALPIHVTGNGIDHLEDATPEPVPEGVLPKAGKVFLHVSSCFPRKGADALLAAWVAAFSKSDDVALVIKTFDNPHNDVRRRVRVLEGQHPDMAPVTVLSQDWSAGQMRGLYRAADVVVLPSRAEGFCLPIAEALLEGCPVLTTGWSGQRAFEGCPMVTFIDYTLGPANSHLGARQSLWAEPSHDDLVRLLYAQIGAPAPDAETKAKARDWLMRTLRWEDVAKRSVAAVRKAAGQEIRWPRIGWVSTFNSRCGIATYSAHLIENIGAPVEVLAPVGAQTVVPDADLGLPVHRCWTDDARDPLLRLFETIERLDLETVVLQFNYAFYDFESLGRLIHRLADAGRQVVLTMHGTDDSRAPSDRQIADIKDALTRCARLLVHNLKDVERLKVLGLVENVTLFPHGCLPASAQALAPDASDPDRAIVLGTYGFLLDNKGLPELIEAVGLLRKRGLDVRLKMLNALYPKEESRLLRERCAQLLLENDLAPFVTLDTEFRPDHYVLGELSACDLVVFPYQHSAESASGAVRYGLAADRPVAVTPLRIFAELSDVTLTLPGISLQDMADGLEQHVRALLHADTFDAMRARARVQSQDLAYSRLGPRLHNMLMGLSVNR